MPAAASHRSLGLTVPVTEALDPVLWRQRYAHGIVLGPTTTAARSNAALRAALGCDGSPAALQAAASQVANEIPNDVIRWHLRVAASELEVKLGIPLGIVIVKGAPADDGLVQGRDYDRLAPRLPYLDSERRSYFRIDLPAGVISVQRVRAFWFGQLVWTVEEGDGMLVLEHPGTSSLHIMPRFGVTLFLSAPTAVLPAQYGAMQLLYNVAGGLPDVWSVDYTLGPVTKTGEVGQIEAVLAHWIACKAGILLMSIGGMAASKGLTSASLSIDGLSKSIGLQASAMYGINSALETRMKEAEEAIDWKALRMYKRGLRVMPFGY